MNNKLKQLELFAWGAFTALTILQFETFTGFDPGAWGKAGMGLAILAGWLFYLFKPSSPTTASGEDQVVTISQKRSVLVLVLLGAVLAFAFTLVIFGRS